jgi:hypothetical protein
MKTFLRSKYEYIGVKAITPSHSEEMDELYFAFRCIKENFSPEVVLVKSARLLYDDWGQVFFDEINLSTSSLSVKSRSKFEKSLVYNERKWRGTERPAQR